MKKQNKHQKVTDKEYSKKYKKHTFYELVSIKPKEIWIQQYFLNELVWIKYERTWNYYANAPMYKEKGQRNKYKGGYDWAKMYNEAKDSHYVKIIN